MKFTEKLNKSKTRSRVACFIALVAAIYFLMTGIKGVYFWTDGSNFPLAQALNEGIRWIFQKTWFFPISNFWEIIPAVPFDGLDIIEFYKVVIPPAVVIGVCALFITDYRILRGKFIELKADVEKEIALREMRKDAGLETLSKSATIDIAIRNATNNDPAWHDTGWGKIIVGVAITLVVTAFGLN